MEVSISLARGKLFRGMILVVTALTVLSLNLSCERNAFQGCVTGLIRTACDYVLISLARGMLFRVQKLKS